jgi:hypothetical protein
LAAKLSETFATYVKDADEDDDASMAAVQCMDAMNTVLQAIHDKPEL